MPNVTDTWFEFLKDRPIPILAPVAVRIQQTLNRAYASHADFANTLIFAPGVTIEMFRSIGRMPGQPKVPIQGLAHAIAMLGLEPLQLAVLRMPSIERIPPEAVPGLQLCYSRAIHASHFALRWAQMKRLRHPEEISLAALVDECGEMALWTNAASWMLKINALREQGCTTDDAAMQVLGTTINRISRKLADYWTLPPLTAESLSNNIYDPRPLCTLLATNLARTIDTTWINPKSTLVLELVREFLGINADKMLALVHQQAAEIARDAQFTGLPMAIHHLPFIASGPTSPAVTDAKPREPLVAAKQKPVDDAGSTLVKKPAKSGDTAVVNLQKAGNLDVERAPARDLPQQDPFTKGLDQVLNFLHKKIGLQRCMYATIREGRVLHSVQVAGVNPGPLREFRQGMDGTLFSALTRRQNSLWLNSENRDKYKALIPRDAGQWATNDSFMMGLFCNGKASGLFYADNNGNPLDARGFSSFQSTISKFAQVLEKNRQCPPPPEQ